VQSFDCTVLLRMVSSCLFVGYVKHLAQFKLRSDVIISGTPKREIQVKVKAFLHAAADVSERGIDSIQLDVRSMMVKI
jgi:hypothetical protein